MKLSLLVCTAATLSSVTSAFAPTFGMGHRASVVMKKPAASALGMSSIGESDFTSAMPEKPKIPIKEQLLTSAKDFRDSIRQNLAEGVEEPEEVALLEKAIESKNPDSLCQGIYILMIEQGMRYDQDPDTGTLTPTEYDVKNNLDVPEVKQEFLYLYKYGMSLVTKMLIHIDDMKDIVTERLVKRTGLEPEEFDEWLGF